MSTFSDFAIALIVTAMISLIVTRPGVAQTFKGISHYTANAIKATLGG